ncbi:MAG: LysE family transporter [Simkania sp.]|nr:LysE family transporter [Simkania sp.]
MSSFFFKGILIGLAIAAPVGPIGILCIRKTLQFGRFSGLFSGLGAAVADMIYGIIAAFGFTLVSSFLVEYQLWLRLVGGAFLISWGGKTFFAKPMGNASNITHKTLLNDFISTFFLTITNPLTILSFVAVFSGFGLEKLHNNYAMHLILGIFIGSSLWWLMLSEGIAFFRKKVSRSTMVWINRTAGLMIMGFGLATWIDLAFHYTRSA